MSQTLTPRTDRVLVKPIEAEEKTYGNIIIPDMGKERPESGIVVAVGPGRTSEFGIHIPVEAIIGQEVLIPKLGTLRMDFEGQEYFIVQDREILCVVTPEEK